MVEQMVAWMVGLKVLLLAVKKAELWAALKAA